MTYIRPGILVLWISTLACGAFAQGAVLEFTTDSENIDHVVVKANSGSYDSVAGIALVKGNVVIESGNFVITTVLATVYEGTDGSGSAERLVLEGNVRITSDDLEATSREGEVFLNENLLLLKGNVRLETRSAVLTGELLTYNTDSGIATLGHSDGSSGGN